ncbi:hypothetical protein [Methanotorris formicicus]|uniref:Uncharacterized protein n=1 Tax=Methanotorris formicicus Mc-S-70 TaxID=647171 RepID=H1KY18_9EURY|nr:hypothetical protein [Methanotorris formicicus]EHP87570.1 hypothetical protein MetfoDRAFT_0691 [Methanotorris formicicus Mc-S-70]
MILEDERLLHIPPGSSRTGVKFKDVANKIDWMERNYYLCGKHDKHIKTVKDLYLMVQNIIQKLLENI